MKKLLLTLIVSLAFCGSIFAQHPDSHWPGFHYNDYLSQAPLYASIMINGEPVTNTTDNWTMMEVAAFVGDEMRMTSMFLTDEYLEYGELFPTLNAEPIYYDNPGEVVTFKMYNHATGEEYGECQPIIWDGDEITILTGEDHWEGFDDPEHPLMLNFTTPGPAFIEWNDPNDWTIPEAYADVTIPANTTVFIPADYTAYAGVITLQDNSTIVIAEGGQLYHSNEVEVNMQLNVTGYGTGSKDDNPNNDGYRLLACPVVSSLGGSTRPIEGTNLNTGTFDLYKFDESQELEWRNFETGEFENLDLGTGYLYANQATIDNVVLRGFAMPTLPEYTLGTTLNYTSGAVFHGMNLLGNPYTCNAYVKVEDEYSPYYVLNEVGDEVVETAVAANTPIAPMKGFFVKATALGQSCLFTTDAPSKSGSLNIIVNKDLNKVDNAIISFGNGSKLEKFQFNPNRTKVYMTQEGKDYAVVNAENEGEMPVSFKAEKNGSYTMSFTNEDVTFSYLHLIDNMTGAEVDLLETPTYTFEARTSDYANRFKLVFATGNSNEDNFAFFSNGSFVINNEGNATLQVIDVTGRIIKSESINGCANVNVNATPGVYMLRLVNGDNVKVQKVVVK